MRKVFDDVLEDCTRLGTKIPKEQYLNNGAYPIIDQGQDNIAGYSNESEGLFTDVPAIIFGDHTRIIKYIDTPCFLGADGVKLLCLKNDKAICKYIYYQLCNTKIPNTGYNRHFKWLKEVKFVLPTKEVQEKVVLILDNVKLLIDKRKKQLKKLDELIKSQFVEMFGDPILNDFNWKKEVCKRLTNKIGSGATPDGGNQNYKEAGISLIRSMNVYDGYFEYKDLAHIDEAQASKLKNVEIEENDILFNITGASVTRTCVVPSDILPARVNQHVSIIRCNEKINNIYLNYLLMNDSFKENLLNIAKAGGGTREAITKNQIENFEIIVPPINLQNQFASFVKQVDKQKFEIEKSLQKMEILYKSLMQEYFG